MRILLRVEVRVRSLLVLDLEFIIKVSNPWGLNFLLLFFFLYFFIKINLSFILFYHRQTKNPVREISVSLQHEFLNVTICSLSLSLYNVHSSSFVNYFIFFGISQNILDSALKKNYYYFFASTTTFPHININNSPLKYKLFALTFFE